MTTLAKGLAVLSSFGEQRQAMTLSEAAEVTGLSRAAARRVLRTLAELGYVVQNGRQFSLAPRILELGFAFLTTQSWIDRAEPLMKELSHSLQESCSAAILQGAEIVYVARMPAPHRIMSTTIAVGTRLPALYTSLGRAQLGFLGEHAVRAWLPGGTSALYTPRTIVDRDALFERIMARITGRVTRSLTRSWRRGCARWRCRSSPGAASMSPRSTSPPTRAAPAGPSSAAGSPAIPGRCAADFAIAALKGFLFPLQCGIVRSGRRAGTRGLSGVIYDIAIIGGGINGCSIARDAAGRGMSVFLCEQGDLGEATSSASTKLIHGGLRYLEHFAFRLVRESLKEREVLLRSAPHIIRPMHCPALSQGHAAAGDAEGRAVLYDHLGARRLLPPTRKIDLSGDPAGRLLDDRFTVAFEYSDCTVDDARLVVLNAMDARTHGASINPGVRCVIAEREGRLWRLALESTDTDEVRGDGEDAGQRRRSLGVGGAPSRDRHQPAGPRSPGQGQPYRRPQAVRRRSRLCLPEPRPADRLRDPL